jgi:hypothetical protein
MPCRRCREKADALRERAGLVGSESERQALIALANEVPGVSAVTDEMIPAY